MIYYIGDGECVKIGYTAGGSAMQRLAELQTANHRELRVLLVLRGGLDGEARLHAHHADLRVRGEWFRCEGELAWTGWEQGHPPSHAVSTLPLMTDQQIGDIIEMKVTLDSIRANRRAV